MQFLHQPHRFLCCTSSETLFLNTLEVRLLDRQHIVYILSLAGLFAQSGELRARWFLPCALCPVLLAPCPKPRDPCYSNATTYKLIKLQVSTSVDGCRTPQAASRMPTFVKEVNCWREFSASFLFYIFFEFLKAFCFSKQGPFHICPAIWIL